VLSVLLLAIVLSVLLLLAIVLSVLLLLAIVLSVLLLAIVLSVLLLAIVLSVLLLAIVLSVLRFTDSDYPFIFFKLFYHVVDVSGTVNHHCRNFLFIIQWEIPHFKRYDVMFPF
jgi:hypothetical protein